jgi:hypothetical protein
VNTNIEAHLYSYKQQWDYEPFGTGTCGAMLDLNDATTNGGESVIVACTYSEFESYDSRQIGLLKNETMPTLLKIDSSNFAAANV